MQGTLVRERYVTSKLLRSKHTKKFLPICPLPRIVFLKLNIYWELLEVQQACTFKELFFCLFPLQSKHHTAAWTETFTQSVNVLGMLTKISRKQH